MLSTKQLHDLKTLQQECEIEEQIQIKLNWDMLKSPTEESQHLFHYIEQELVGFLGMYSFGSKIELCGMIKPSYRRQGIFSQLFIKALEKVSNGKYRTILLNAPANSTSAKGFLKNHSCRFAMTEQQMKWAEMEFDNESENVILRYAKEDDYLTEVELDRICFDFKEEEAKEYNERIKNDKQQKFYMIDYKGKTVGKIRVAHIDEEKWIYGFAIFPEYQGKGIGKHALQKLVKLEHKGKYPIFLEVETQNSNALRLYEKCGFHSYQAQDYYSLLIVDS